MTTGSEREPGLNSVLTELETQRARTHSQSVKFSVAAFVVVACGVTLALVAPAAIAAEVKAKGLETWFAAGWTVKGTAAGALLVTLFFMCWRRSLELAKRAAKLEDEKRFATYLVSSDEGSALRSQLEEVLARSYGYSPQEKQLAIQFPLSLVK